MAQFCRYCDHMLCGGRTQFRFCETYAMTAWRSPQVEKLIEILQTVDWGDV